MATLETLLVPLGRRTPAHLKNGALHLYLDVEVWAGLACAGFVPVYLSPPTRSQRGFNLASALSDRLFVDVFRRLLEDNARFARTRFSPKGATGSLTWPGDPGDVEGFSDRASLSGLTEQLSGARSAREALERVLRALGLFSDPVLLDVQAAIRGPEAERWPTPPSAPTSTAAPPSTYPRSSATSASSEGWSSPAGARSCGAPGRAFSPTRRSRPTW